MRKALLKELRTWQELSCGSSQYSGRGCADLASK
jgi:hypothetical protein